MSHYINLHCSSYINMKTEEVQFKALELLPQMNNNAQISIWDKTHVSVMIQLLFPLSQIK